MNVRIVSRKLQGSIDIMPSKSYSHRAIILASLACGRSIISNITLSQDILATIKVMEELGAKIKIDQNRLVIDGGIKIKDEYHFDAYDSGSTLRFLLPVALTLGKTVYFSGKKSLAKRPLDCYYPIFNKSAIKYFHPDQSSLPFMASGQLQSGTYEVAGDVSSQFITGLLFALPLLERNSKIVLTSPLESQGYIAMTLDILAKFGIKIINNNFLEFIIFGGQKYQPCNYTVEGDYSQAAFFLVADALGADIKICGLNSQSLQGDKKILADLKAFGCSFKNSEGLICLPSNTQPKELTIDFSQTPDLGPILAVLSSLWCSKVSFVNAKRLRLKESDRLAAMALELTKLGAKIIQYDDGMDIFGCQRLNGAVVDSHNDHRVAMALAMATLKMNGDLVILNAECVNKSFPNFWEVFLSLGGEIYYE